MVLLGVKNGELFSDLSAPLSTFSAPIFPSSSAFPPTSIVGPPCSMLAPESSSVSSETDNKSLGDMENEGLRATGSATRGYRRRQSSDLVVNHTPPSKRPYPASSRRKCTSPMATSSECGQLPGPSPEDETQQESKIRKVSRACDFCKARKARCTGDLPCQKCLVKGRVCLYSAKYTRGRPPTPPRSTSVRSPTGNDGVALISPDRYTSPAVSMELSRHPHHPDSESAAPSRASPELGLSEIQGQVFDPTSGFSFLHRAWKRLSARNAGSIQGDSRTVSSDKPLAERREHAPLQLPEPDESRRLVALYFDVCIATYRVLHRPTVEEWLTVVERNVSQDQPVWHSLGRSRAAVVLVVLAIAAAHHEKSKGISSQEDETRALSLSDELFGVSLRLVDVEMGPPRFESAQARLVQVLYLLTTSRFNRAWFVFGSALQLISALGLHRRANPKKHKVTREDYIQTQCGLRLFWSAYILDNYLGVVFGRPRHYNDDDIDQVCLLASSII